MKRPARNVARKKTVKVAKTPARPSGKATAKKTKAARSSARPAKTSPKRTPAPRVAKAGKPGAAARMPVFVSKPSFDSKDPEDIVASNVSVVNRLFEEHFTPEEIPHEALVSYYVDYYLAQVENGGLSQFVYNSGASKLVFSLVAEGLVAMGAKKHAALFERLVAQVRALGKKRIEAYFASDYFGANAARDELEKHTDTFYSLSKRENLTELNARWLRTLPHLAVLPLPVLEEEIAARGASLPNRKARILAALANEPDYAKAIRALCNAAGQTLDRITAGDPTHEHDGKRTLAWHFLTDAGHHYMVETSSEVIMFRAKPKKLVITLPT